MRRQHHHEQQGAGAATVPGCDATRRDLELVVRRLAQAEALRAEALTALIRVRARGDGEAVAGMSVAQHLRWNTNLRAGTISTLQTITDVADELPTVLAAARDGSITLDQVAAIAWPAARVSRSLRRSLDVALATDDGWRGLSPDSLEFEVTRLLEDLAPQRTAAEELEREQRQYLHLQPTLDGQGLKFWGQAWGVDAAEINARLDAAADAPEATEPDPDGILVGRPTRRSNQLFDGLLRIFRSSDPETRTAPDVTIYAVVDETSAGAGSGELMTARRGLAPRLSAAAVRRLDDQGARRVEVFAVDGELVAVKGRAGHAVDDPASLSEDTTRIIIRVRDRTCRMAGCDRPVEHLHHLVWRGLARARGAVAPDDPGHLAGLCLECHQLVHRWRWSGTVGTVGRITWNRGATTVATLGRIPRRLPRPPPHDRDQFGDPLPF